MRSLRELQREFARGVLASDEHAICSAIAACGIEPERRLQIYRNNAREGFLTTLEATFPIIVKLAGLDWFQQAGLAYRSAHPSTSGNLHFVGRHFAAFLDADLAGTAHSYFGDVARLEWAYQEVLVAGEHAPFDVGTLSSIEPDDYAALRFDVQPASRIVASVYPLFAIWQANKESCSDAITIDLNAGPSRVLVIRRADHVELRELAAADAVLLDAFTRGESLGDAAQLAAGVDDSFDLGRSLARIVQLGCLADVHVGAAVPRDPTSLT